MRCRFNRETLELGPPACYIIYVMDKSVNNRKVK